MILSFLLCVVGPAIYANWYLHEKAADQYASNLAFTIQSDEGGVTSILGDFLGGSSGGGAADDAEVLYGFIRSQNLVETLQERYDLRAMFRKPEEDWFFSLGRDGSIEELVDYWETMCLVAFDAGIVEVEVRAFDPQDAQIIARAVLEESTKQINRMSEEARADAVRDSEIYLSEAEERLRRVRAKIAELREREQSADPTSELAILQGQISALEAERTSELLKLDELLQFAPEGDSRVGEARRRLGSLDRLIVEVRSKYNDGVAGGDSLGSFVSEMEELEVDREIAQQAYAAALASHENARTEARRKQRYLSAHVAPTLSETPQYPQRLILGGLATLFLFMGWAILVMIAYNVRDRR